MYMIGSVAALHRGLSSIEELHRDVCQGAADRLRELTAGLPDPAAPLPPEPEAPLAIIGMACLLPGPHRRRALLPPDARPGPRGMAGNPAQDAGDPAPRDRGQFPRHLE